MARCAALVGLLLGAGMAVLPLSCTIISGSSDISYSGNYVGEETFSRVIPGKSKEFVEALLGAPTSRAEAGEGIEIWKWAYTERKSSSGGLILIFSGSSRAETRHNLFVKFQDGKVAETWRD